MFRPVIKTTKIPTTTSSCDGLRSQKLSTEYSNWWRQRTRLVCRSVQITASVQCLIFRIVGILV